MLARTYLGWTTQIGPPTIRRAIVNLLPWKAAHQIRDIADTMYNTSVEILNSKRRALDEGDVAIGNQIGQGKDILSILRGYQSIAMTFRTMLTHSQFDKICLPRDLTVFPMKRLSVKCREQIQIDTLDI